MRFKEKIRRKFRIFLSGCFEFWIFEFWKRLSTWRQVSKSHSPGRFWGLLEMCSCQEHKSSDPTLKLSISGVLAGPQGRCAKSCPWARTHTHTRARARCFLESVCVFDICIPGGVICVFWRWLQIHYPTHGQSQVKCRKCKQVTFQPELIEFVFDRANDLSSHNYLGIYKMS